VIEASSIPPRTAFRAIFCAVLLGAQALADGPIKKWDPASVIDSSQLIVVAEPMHPPRQQAVAIVPGSPIGVIMELRVLRVLDGENTAEGAINVF
jgi:hypothetical protein